MVDPVHRCRDQLGLVNLNGPFASGRGAGPTRCAGSGPIQVHYEERPIS